MSPTHANAMEYDSPHEAEENFFLAYLGVFVSLFYFLWLHRDRARYQNIPSVGFSGTFTSFFSAFRWLYDQTGLVKRGYLKFPNGIFRYPTLRRWIVVIARPKFVEELRKVPENEVSASAAMNEILGLSYTINSGLLADQELKSLLGSQITRSLQDFIPGVHPVVAQFVAGLVPTEEDGWKYVDETEVAADICNRIVNTVVVGPTLSQNTDFVNQVAVVTRDLERYARNLNKIPKFLRLVYVLLFTPLPRIKRRLRVLLATTLKERQNSLDESEDSCPNDMITWILGHDTKSDLSIDELLAHILLVNYLAAYPMAKILSQALRNLAKHPGYVKPLRTEVEESIRSGGWTKPAIDKMQKVDSFLKETMRLDSSSLNPSFPKLTMARKCLRPLTFSDGTTIPQDTLLFVGSQLLHTDAIYYPKPESFDPLRFSPPINDDLSPPISSHSPDSHYHSYSEISAPSLSTMPVSLTLPATSATFLAWGHGKHACPGRFFATSVMKLVLAQFVFEFDVRLPPIHESFEDQQGSGEKSTDILWIELKRRRHKYNPGIL